MSDNEKDMALTNHNYKLMLIGLAAVLLGFILMAGGGSEDPTIFSREIFSFRRITLAPFLVMGGYIFVIYAIMKRPKGADAISETSIEETTTEE